MDRLIYLRDVVTLRLDEKKCIGCGMCLLVCPHSVLSLTNGKIEIANEMPAWNVAPVPEIVLPKLWACAQGWVAQQQ